ncbi:hypothetical protein [Mesorhizobium sp. M0767]|uniref:hypothetical protein n=1 Tax=Mesorhizobium sp. M0767 TaxID=2956995 RepID=UPI0033355DCF
MTALHKRLVTLDQGNTPYELDYLVMKSGFVYRRARVLSHDEETLFISQDDYPETYITISEVASVRISRI